MVTFINTYKQPIMVNGPGRPRATNHIWVFWVREFNGHIYKHRQTTNYGKLPYLPSLPLECSKIHHGFTEHLLQGCNNGANGFSNLIHFIPCSPNAMPLQ